MPVGGGGGADGWGGTDGQRVGSLLSSSISGDKRGWVVKFEKADMSSVTVTAWVACAKIPA